MQVDDPPYLAVGTAVSAKYKGAFCEAKVHKLVKCVKCKVTFKSGLGTATVSDTDIKGSLRVGQVVQVKHPTNAKDYVEATITKMQDCSQYTVVFDDGDITTLRRTALCLKSGRHFNESETLDQLPLTNPEHFGNPVVGGRRGRRNRHLKEDSSEGEPEEENEPDLEGYSVDIGRVKMYEQTDKKRIKDSWFPGLVVIPSSTSTTGKINVKEEYLIRSFKDGRYYTVPKKETRDFHREEEIKSDSSQILTEAVHKALRYLDHNELPVHWERSSLFNTQTMDSDSEDILSDSSDDEPSEEKDLFVAQLYKFLDDSGTPLNKTPSISGKDIDLHRLFRIVHKLGGYNRVNNKTKWKSVTTVLKLPCNQNTFNQVKSVYKRCLLSYENFNRALGVTMLNHTRSTKKSGGRSLIRDKDRATPVNSPRPEKEDEFEKKEEPKPAPSETKNKRKSDVKKDDDKKKKENETSDTNSSSDATDQSESTGTSKDVRRPKRADVKGSSQKKGKSVAGEKVRALVDKFEEQQKKEADDKVQQQTRSKSNSKIKEPVTPEKKPELKTTKEPSVPKGTPSTKIKKSSDDDKKKASSSRKRNMDEKIDPESATIPNVNIGDKLKVYYGPTHESKVTYEAKVIQIGKDGTGTIYLVHYTGWNTRYDEWIAPGRIAENLSASSKAKRLKQGHTPSSKASTASSTNSSHKVAAKRGRGQSISGKSAEIPRSTTPSSVTSSSSRTKSPATPATRSASRSQVKLDKIRSTRRTSGQTDISNHSESESEASDSELEETTRTRTTSVKVEEPEVKTYKRKIIKPPSTPKVDKRKEKDDDDTEKEEDTTDKFIKRTRRIKKVSEKSADESDDDSGNPPKGRDFDLNQIRSELKGFSKPIPANEISEKDAISSSDDSTNLPPEKPEEETEDRREKSIEKTTDNSDDIYEFKEPEPFEFESRSKLTDEKNNKKRLVSRLFDDVEKSPKKKSPVKVEMKEDSPELDKKRFQQQKSPVKSQESDKEARRSEDPFDTLVQSPSYNYIKTSDKNISDIKPSAVRNLHATGMGELFNDLNDTVDDYSTGDMELSDSESQMPNIFSGSSTIFHESFSKPSPDPNTMDMDFSSGKTDECKKDSDDDDNIRAQVQRLINQSSSTDDDSNEPLVITRSTSSYQAKKREIDSKPLSTILGIPSTSSSAGVFKEKEEEMEMDPPLREPSPMDLEPAPLEEKPIMEQSVFVPIKPSPPIQISPALQETDSSLLESIVSSPVLAAKLDEPTIEFGVKKSSGSKIADSILQKFNSIKKMEGKSPKRESDEGDSKKDADSVKEEIKPKINLELKQKPTSDLNLDDIKPIKSLSDMKSKPLLDCKPSRPLMDFKPKMHEHKSKLNPIEVKVETKPKLEVKNNASPVPKMDNVIDVKKRRKNLSKQYIEESDTDSSDSEQLVIARSDEDSQSNSMENKADTKESDSNISQLPTTDDSQSQDPSVEERNFKFDNKAESSNIGEFAKEVELKEEPEPPKDEEPDQNFHSLLLCEETIPRSPAPVPEPQAVDDVKPAKPVLEMPFASAPGTSNCKSVSNMLLDQQQQQPKLVVSPKPQAAPVNIVVPVEREIVRENRGDASVVMDNTPPTTPESTISNLSPRGENGGLSPNAADNESCKSNDIDPDYSLHRRNSSNKVTAYSEEDTQMTSEAGGSKKRDEMPGSTKKRRRSCRTEDVPVKRGRKPLNRTRHNSDSDDTSEHSINSTNMGSFDISERTPRPTRYNFLVELDDSMDSVQRIAMLQQKMAELRKTYADVKAELAIVERRRKKIRRREREALKASKQEATST
ncbi:AT-rich interactive domain-containing protein 4B isoform X2 [Aethina tumida]|uniref:AT-rich interactive domain-containing protein 4B isoform X2 n=1 Tax=Aethina tumida TaxID=116153 RepID=UPI002147B5D9|nr:AT-rich interactive domain-containing protein 4B isoform X2 [Aethina tumida]